MLSSLFDVSFDPGKVVALIPTLMSIVGSVNVARLVKRSPSFHHSAKRILMGLSLCEVISSLAFAMNSLFIPRVTSHFLWAIGNGSALGLWMQFSISSYIFSCFVSFVYLSKISLGGGANRDFCRTRIEPWMGALGGFGYPLLTAALGLAMRYYAQQEFLPLPQSSLSFTNDNHYYNEISSSSSINSNSIHTNVSQRQLELSAQVGQFLFPGYPVTNLLAAIAVNSCVMYIFVRGTSSSHQHQRDALLRARTNSVATASVLLTYGWTAILKVLESNDISHYSKRGLEPLVWLQLVLLPALALANGITWLQPRFVRIQTLYPHQSTVWCLGRAFMGKAVSPEGLTKTTHNRLVNSSSFDFAARRHCRF